MGFVDALRWRWQRATPAARSALKFVGASLAAFGISITGAGAWVAEQAPKLVLLELQPETPPQWGSQRLVAVAKPAFGELRLTPVPPCTKTSADCAVSVQAKISPVWGTVLVALPLGVLFSLAFAFFSARSQGTYVATRRLAVKVAFKPEGGCREEWRWEGLHCEQRELEVIQDLFDFRSKDAEPPKITTLDLVNNPGATWRPKPLLGELRYAGAIVLRKQDVPPINVGYDVEVTKAYATNLEMLKRTRLQSPGDPEGWDYWEFYVSYPIQLLEVEVSGFGNMTLLANTLPSATRKRASGAGPETVSAPEWNQAATKLALKNLDVGETVRIEWFLG